MTNSSISKDASIYIAGSQGMVGAALCRQLRQAGYSNLLTQSRTQLDLTDQSAVKQFFEFKKPEYVILAAAKVGGIQANNTLPADFIYSNLMIECNVIHAALVADVKRLLFLGSSCIYPRQAQQPMSEEALLTGQLEQTNEPYAIAKIAGIKLCESYNRQHGTDYRSVMPTNLYGPGDNFDANNSHVVSALIRKMHEAKVRDDNHVIVWGTGSVRREFMFVEDMAKACMLIFGLEREIYQSNTTAMQSHINIGTGADVTIAQLARKIANIVGFKGELQFDQTKPDGARQKLLDISRLKAMGWSGSVPLEQGLRISYQWFIDNLEQVRGI